MKKITTFTAIALVVLLSLQNLPLQVQASEAVVYSEGFENNNGGYTTAGISKQWQWGTPTNPNGTGSAHSGTKCWATNLTGDVPHNSASYLTSPQIILPSTASNQVLRVRFYAWIAIDEVWDKGEFQVSSDGTSFVILVDLFHTMQGSWSAYDFDITNYAGGPIYLRFRLYTDNEDPFKQSTPNMAGLYIDDVKITLCDSSAEKTTLTLEAWEEQNSPSGWFNVSCPWVFSWNGSGFVQDNDIYSTARGINQEYTDYYKLNTPLVPADGKYLLDIREVTDETSYTDFVKLVAVDHSAATKVAPDENGSIWTYSNPVAPVSAIDGKGSDVSVQLSDEDSLVYKGYNGDTVTLDFGDVDTTHGATLVLQAIGFKDDGDLGTSISGSPRIFIQTQDASGNWISRHYFYPRNNLSTEAFDLTACLTDNKLVRLYVTSCHSGKYFAIDYVGLDNSVQASATAYSLSPVSATHSINDDILAKIANSDGAYASMGPGETMSMSFDVPAIVDEARDFVLITRGYYLPSGTYFIHTWDGTSWVEREGWSILSGGDQTHTFDMSLFLPDPNGQFKVRIWQDFWYFSAGIDYVSLTHAGASANLTSAFDLQKNLDVTSLLNASDNSKDEWLADNPGSIYPEGRTRNRWVEVTFTTQGPKNTPPTTSPITVTDLTRATPTISWKTTDANNDPQTKYEVEVWTFSGGTGNIMWDPAPSTGTTQSVIYAGSALSSGKTYYARAKAFDGKDWGQWSETAFTSNAAPPPTITILSPENKEYPVGTAIQLTFTLDKLAAWIGYSLDNQPTVTITGNTTLPSLPIGGHRVTVYASTFGSMGVNTIYFTLLDMTKPVANAGRDQTVNEGTLTTLDATGSTDNVAIATYTWAFADTTTKTLTGSKPTYTFTTPGTYTITLNVTDTSGNWATDTVTITVLDATKPSANAGLNKQVNEDNLTTLDGSGSSDNVGIATYSWTFTDVTTKTLVGEKPAYIFTTPGVYTITLNVTDAAGNWAVDTVIVTVLDVTKPVVNAGLDRAVNEDVSVTLDGSGSSDNAGLASYSWTFTDGTVKTLIGDKPVYMFSTPGVYAVTLNASDAAGNWVTDTVVITVLDVTSPVADAGLDRAITEDVSTSLDGSNSSDNIGVSSYTWTFVDVSMKTLVGDKPVYAFSTPGVYSITLNVTDSAGNWATDTVIITVLDITSPLPDAGLDRTVDEDVSIALDGSVSSDNFGIVKWTWTFTDVTAKTLFGMAPSYTFNTPGVYTVTLTVEDAAGNRATDTVTITVLDVTDPVANAGLDRTVDEDVSIALDGSGSSDNIGIASYTWIFADVTVKTLVGVKPVYTFSAPGVYTVALNVTDAAGNWAVDTMVIVVLDVTDPVANAGQDQTVEAGTTVAFNAGNSTDSVAIASYEWNFGDGTSGTGITTTHEYADAGTYTVTLTVRDAAGNQAADTFVVTVNIPRWIVAAASIMAVGIVVTAVALWRRRKKTQRDNQESSLSFKLVEAG
jgi:PKD repeat protein